MLIQWFDFHFKIFPIRWKENERAQRELTITADYKNASCFTREVESALSTWETKFTSNVIDVMTSAEFSLKLRYYINYIPRYSAQTS